MSKLRNHNGDTTVGMAQWIGRKIRHHDPVSEKDSFRTTRVGQKHMRVGVKKDNPHAVVYLTSDGQRFEITVRAMKPEEGEPLLVAVGA